MEHLALTGGEETVGDLQSQLQGGGNKQAQIVRVLDKIYRKLIDEDKVLRSYRRALAFSQVFKKDLIPILLSPDANFDVRMAVVKVMVTLTVPVECLYPIESVNASASVRELIFEFNGALTQSKELFRDPKSTSAIMEILSEYSEKADEIKTPEVSLVSNCLLLIRNILHIPESSQSAEKNCWLSTTQNQILWNLFSQNLDKVLLDLIKNKCCTHWCTSIVQLIALVYKDQHVVNLQKRLQNFLESSLSDSSGDNESNTCHQDQNGYCSSPITTDPVTTDDTSEESIDRSPYRNDSGENNTNSKVERRNSICSLEVVPNASPVSNASEADSMDTGEDGTATVATHAVPGQTAVIGGNITDGSTSGKGASDDVEMHDSAGAASQGPEVPDQVRILQSLIRVNPSMERILSNKGEVIKSSRNKEANPKSPGKKDQFVSPDAANAKSNNQEQAPTGNRRQQNNSKEENKSETNSSGVDSSISNNEQEPPNKKYMMESESGELTVINRRSPRREAEYEHKECSPHHSSISNGQEKGSGSDSSSTTTGIPKKATNTSGSTTDYGYVSQQTRGNQESNSTSSNEDVEGLRAAHHRSKPVKLRAKKVTNLTPLEKREKHKQRLLKRSQENRMRSKAMINHSPTDQDISELLKEFTVDFLLTGYSNLVREMLMKLNKNARHITKDKSHFLWLITYFLKFASQLEIGMDQLGSVLSFHTIAYITFEGVDVLETLELATKEPRDMLHAQVRRMHLVVTAMREFIQTMSNYNKILYLNQGDKDHLLTLQLQVLATKEIRQLLLLLLRRYNPSMQTRQYLTDLIVCNHMLLLNLEKINVNPAYNGPSFDLVEHVRQFASTELMGKYGALLEGFEQNSEEINDCIFTMMHHVAGDLGAPQALFIPSVLKSFAKIWEKGMDICEDWVDLIEYIIQKFLNLMGNSPHICAANIVECMNDNVAVDDCGLTRRQANDLFWNFQQVSQHDDPIGSIIEIYRRSDSPAVSRLNIIQALLSNGIITHAQYMNFMYMKSVMSQCKTEHEDSVIAEVGSEHCHSDGGHITDTEESADHPSMPTGQSQSQHTNNSSTGNTAQSYQQVMSPLAVTHSGNNASAGSSSVHHQQQQVGSPASCYASTMSMQTNPTQGNSVSVMSGSVGGAHTASSSGSVASQQVVPSTPSTSATNKTSRRNRRRGKGRGSRSSGDGDAGSGPGGSSHHRQDSPSGSEITLLTDCLVKQGREGLVSWVQEVLLEVCRVKMYPDTLIPAIFMTGTVEGSETGPEEGAGAGGQDSDQQEGESNAGTQSQPEGNGQNPSSHPVPHEPIPYFYNLAKQSIPLVPFNRLQYQGLETESFILLLHKLGFLLPADVGKVFPRIPHFWSADHLYSVAAKLGPIRQGHLKFSLEELEAHVNRQRQADGGQHHVVAAAAAGRSPSPPNAGEVEAGGNLVSAENHHSSVRHHPPLDGMGSPVMMAASPARSLQDESCTVDTLTGSLGQLLSPPPMAHGLGSNNGLTGYGSPQHPSGSIQVESSPPRDQQSDDEIIPPDNRQNVNSQELSPDNSPGPSGGRADQEGNFPGMGDLDLLDNHGSSDGSPEAPSSPMVINNDPDSVFRRPATPEMMAGTEWVRFALASKNALSALSVHRVPAISSRSNRNAGASAEGSASMEQDNNGNVSSPNNMSEEDEDAMDMDLS